MLYKDPGIVVIASRMPMIEGDNRKSLVDYCSRLSLQWITGMWYWYFKWGHENSLDGYQVVV